MNAEQLKGALRSRYQNNRQYVALCEFRPGTGYGVNSERWIDFYVIQCWGDLHTLAFEIKVSRSDFLAELKQPEKRRLALHYSHEFYFVAPAGMIKPEELPVEAGLLEAREEFGVVVLREKRSPLHRETARPTWRFVAAVARACNSAAAQAPAAQDGGGDQ